MYQVVQSGKEMIRVFRLSNKTSDSIDRKLRGNKMTLHAQLQVFVPAKAQVYNP
jgi:hypothetical protein